MGRLFSIAAVACAAVMYGCDYKYGSGTVDPEDLPAVTLDVRNVEGESAELVIDVRSSSKAAYICLSPSIIPPDAAGVLRYGQPVATEGETRRTVGGLKPVTKYIVYAASTDGNTYSKVVSQEFTTLGIMQPSVELTAEEPSATSVRFMAVVSGADRGAYLCREADSDAPDAETVLASGRPLSIGAQTAYVVGELRPATEYVVYAAASRNGTAGPVTSLPMATKAE